MNAIVIMAKAPLPDVVKTRLLPHLKPVEAAILYRCFLLDKIEQVKLIDKAHHYVAYTPGHTRDIFEEIVPTGFRLIEQAGADLGEKLSNISKNLFIQGFNKVILIDSDSPNLPPEYISQALDHLDDADVVIGPCYDGGYYLIGTGTHTPELFEGIPWSTSRVTEYTIKNVQNSGMVVSMLETWYDVDTIEDLLRLKKDLDISPRKIPHFFCENTYNALSKIEID